MSGSHPEMPKTTVSQFLLALVGALIPVLIVVFLLVKLVLGIQATHINQDDPAKANELMASRLKPVGEVAFSGSGAATAGGRSGEEIVTAICSACHATGALNAPKIGDKGAWGPRIAKGYDTLVKHAVSGIRAMPPRGGAADLSDEEVARAVAFMANKGGASFKAPEPKAAPAVQAAAGGAADGKKVFDGTCVACHGAGVAGAPKAGDKAAWGPRIAQGKDTLYKHALGGFTGKSGAMPAKGGNAGLADGDVKAAVDYMVGLAK